MQKQLTTILILTLLSVSSYSQELLQTVRGQIIDQDSEMPLIGATVLVVGSDPIVGTVTDLDGAFKLPEVPVGRVTLQFALLGYEPLVLPNVLVQSGKETVLDVKLAEGTVKLKTVEITSEKKDGDPLNDMALVSARAFTVEETKRYAGAFQDPARLVSAYAGVTSNPEGNNDIVVRGNSPKGIQWRLEGIEIPNPNHFADEGSSGGPISALNSNMLANSDFYTGAFPAEYGNAYSGVFDMKLRKGNNEKREYSFGLGALGLDAALEGPLAPGSKASYLVNYRYSSLALLDAAGIVDFDGVPKYQDGSFKLHVPTKGKGTFTLFGMGGISGIVEMGSSEMSDRYMVEEGIYKARMGVVGLNHFYALTPNTYLKTSVSAATNGSGYDSDFEFFDRVVDGDSLDFDDATTGRPDSSGRGISDNLDKVTYRASMTLNRKINAKHNVRAGVVAMRHNFNFYTEDIEVETGEREIDINRKGDAYLARGFVSWKYRITPSLTMVAGLHSMKFELADEFTLEPRASLQWQLSPVQWINGGFGTVSRHESLTTYYTLSTEGQSQNTDLNLQKARHYVLGYKRLLGENLYAKVEAYYQQLYDVPVDSDPTSTYSTLNMDDWYTTRNLVNEGEGKNYGLELTVERYYANNFYFLFSGSLYDSKFTTVTGQEFNTKYNGNYTANFLIGKEWNVGKESKKRVLGVNTKLFLSGPRRYTPVDRVALAEGETRYMHENPFSAQGDVIWQVNYAMSLRTDRGKTTRELSLDILNVTNNQARLYEYVNDGEVDYGRQLAMIPNLIYRVYF